MLIIGYLLLARHFFVFVFGPFDWPIDNWGTLFGFLGATMFALWLGLRWLAAGRRPEARSADGAA